MDGDDYTWTEHRAATMSTDDTPRPWPPTLSDHVFAIECDLNGCRRGHDATIASLRERIEHLELLVHRLINGTD